MVPEGVTVVAALHTVSAPTLADTGADLDEDVLLCGDRKADKAKVARLIEEIAGLRAVNAGPLEMARIVEQLTPMLISINARYKTHAGIRITGLPGRRPLAVTLRSSVTVVCLAGGTGGAKLAAGLQDLLGDELAVIANTADDVEVHGAPRLPRPRPGHLLARRRDRRGARLGDPRRHLHRPRAARAARRARAGSRSPTATSPPASTGPTSSPRAAP